MRWLKLSAGFALFTAFLVYLFYWGWSAIFLALATMLRGDMRLFYDAKTVGGFANIIISWIIVLANPATVAFLSLRTHRWIRSLQSGVSNGQL